MANGTPLDVDDDLFTPTSGPQTSSNLRLQRRERQMEMPTKEEQLKWLQKQANEAKGNARMLTEALAFCDIEQGGIEENELISVSFFFFFGIDIVSRH